MKFRASIALAIALAASGLTSLAHATDSHVPVTHVVIVHGAFADGSGWKKVADILTRRGLHVAIVQEPLTSLQDDIDATRRVLDLQTGPTLLVAHSYGGMVITAAGNHPAVAGLVYVAAFEPDEGESLFSLASSRPAATQAIRETADGQYLYLDPAQFVADFAADAPRAEADFMARAQVFAAKAAATAPAPAPAWKNKKSWAMVATQDRAINPDLERAMARRAGSVITEIKSSHAVYAAHPQQVADFIMTATHALEDTTR